VDNLGFIDIEIPNVFNPSSTNDEVNTWYPDNLIFGDLVDVFSIPTDGLDLEDGTVIITVTVGGTK